MLTISNKKINPYIIIIILDLILINIMKKKFTKKCVLKFIIFKIIKIKYNTIRILSTFKSNLLILNNSYFK